MLIAQSRGTTVEPDAVDPNVTPAPRITVPVEASDDIAAGQGVLRTPKRDVARVAALVPLPLLGDEVRVGEKVVKNIGVQDRLALKLRMELLPLNDFTIELGLRQIESHLLGVPLEQTTALLVLFHSPAVGNERVGVQIDDMFRHLDFRLAVENRPEIAEFRVLAEHGDFFGSKSLRLQGLHQLVCLAFGVSRHVSLLLGTCAHRVFCQRTAPMAVIARKRLKQATFGYNRQ